MRYVHCRHPKPRYTPRMLQTLGWPGTQYLRRRKHQYCSPPAPNILLRCMTISVCELTEIHDVVPTNSAVVYNDVPGPKCNSIPLKKGKRRKNKWSSYMIMLHCLCCNRKISKSKYKQTALVVYFLINMPLLTNGPYSFHNFAVVSFFLNKQSKSIW